MRAYLRVHRMGMVGTPAERGTECRDLSHRAKPCSRVLRGRLIPFSSSSSSTHSDNHRAEFITIFYFISLLRTESSLSRPARPPTSTTRHSYPLAPRYLYSSRSPPFYSPSYSNRKRNPFALRRSFGACVRSCDLCCYREDGGLRVASDEEGGRLRGAAGGGGHRVPVRVRDVGHGLHAVVVGGQGGARGRRHLQLQLRLDGQLRDGFAHGAAPAQEGLSKFFDGKSQSFASLAAVGSLEDLAKPPSKRLKASRSCEVGLQDAHRRRFCRRNAAAFKKVAKGRLSVLGKAHANLTLRPVTARPQGCPGEELCCSRRRFIRPQIQSVSVVACPPKSSGCGCYVDFDTVTISTELR